MSAYDLIVRGGYVVDGTGLPRRLVDGNCLPRPRCDAGVRPCRVATLARLAH